MSDRRYSTSAWQRTRKAVLMRDGRQCMIQGPRCTGTATTVHHIIPSSERPDLFYAGENLVAACARCNYSGGRRVAVENRRNQIERLEDVIRFQQEQIAELVEKVQQLEAERPQPANETPPPKAAVY